ncbi:MAG: Mur ligase family protein [Balneola sp.]
MSAFKTIQDVWDYLDKIPKFQDKGASASNFAIDNISKFCALIGNPQDSYPSIHVAGTNGKGTTCYLLEAVYSKEGYKTGMFTSPHLIRYNERFRISGKEVDDALILEFFNKYSNQLEECKLTFFEISTALSFWLFAKEKVDIAIIETGLGGRLDSTNIVHPKACVITSIGLDHQDVLGNTEADIAREKAGIIKNETPVILGNISDENEQVLIEIARSKKAPIYRSKDLAPVWDNGILSIESGELVFNTQLKEEVNKWNIASVLYVVKALKNEFPVSSSNLSEAIEIFSGAPARFEKLLSEKDWYFSGAHNTQALKSTLDTAKNISDKPLVIVFSMMKDKLNLETVELMKGCKQLYYHELSTERAAAINEVKDLVDAKEIDKQSYKSIFKEFETSLVIFTGSFYFYSTVKRWVSNC